MGCLASDWCDSCMKNGKATVLWEEKRRADFRGFGRMRPFAYFIIYWVSKNAF